MSKRIKRNILVIVAVLLLSIVPICYCANSVSKYEEELEKVKQEEAQNVKNLTGVERELALYAYDIADIDSQALEVAKTMEEIQTDIDKVQKELESLQNDLDNAGENYSIANSSYVARLRSIYESGIPTIFDLIVSSNSFVDFMIKVNLYTLILDHDKLLMTTYQDRQSYINYVSQEIELDKQQLESLLKGAEDLKTDLDKRRQEKEERVAKLQDQQSSLLTLSQTLTEKKKKAASDLDGVLASIISDLNNDIANGVSSTFTGTEFAYPTPGHTIITTQFGEVYNLVNPAGSAHTGADIASGNINGTPIYAIQDGTVTTSGYSNYGYGNYIIINHGACVDDGKAYISLYGHCSSLSVKEGEVVKKGQLIGHVGTTGNSTGPHLHLEVFVNGQRTNPLQFFPSVQFTYY